VDEVIDFVDMEIIYPKHMSAQLKQLVTVEWNGEQLNGCLPIGREHNATFDITISVKGDFVFQIKQSSIVENFPTRGDKMTVDNNSLTQKKSQVLGSSKLANFINELQTKKFNNEMANLSRADSDLANEPDVPKELYNSKVN